MPATSLVKFMGRNQNGGTRGSLHWGRADIDGAPFRGSAPPMLPEEEMEARLTKVRDPHNATFDTSDAEQNKEYLDVLDKIANGWAELIARKHIPVRFKKKTEKGIERGMRMLVYIEWVEYYMEDGQPMESQRPYIGRSNED